MANRPFQAGALIVAAFALLAPGAPELTRARVLHDPSHQDHKGLGPGF